MELSDLAAYAREKHDIQEQHKWADFPGFSVLAEPQTGKWAALLMRQWDAETGAELQRCDIKCGRQCLAQIHVPWLTMPFRMKGQNWVGVILDRRTNPELVYRLFDRAVASIGQQRAYTVILEEMRGNTDGLYHDTVLPPRKKRGRGLRGEQNLRNLRNLPNLPEPGLGLTGQTETGFGQMELIETGSGFPGPAETAPGQENTGYFADADAPGNSPVTDPSAWSKAFFRAADEWKAGRSGGYSSTEIPQVPQKIRDMIRLYEYRGESLEEKCRNFYRQGKFMEDYEDDAPWTGEYRRYFTTYHDLHLHQLRGYFTWRTAVRRGEFRPITTSLAYMYVYELLCGIGTASPEDSLQKMREFEKGFLDSGIGDLFMRRNLHRWMLDYAVLHAVPIEITRLYEIPAIAARDLQMAVLKEPEKYSDKEIFAALCAFGNKKLSQSPVVTGHDEKGSRLFAALWRKLTAQYTGKQTKTEKETGADAAAAASTGPEQEPEKKQKQEQEQDSAIFTACFGKRKSYPWNPLSNAIHWEEEKPQEAEYVLNPCRSYRCHEGEWTEERYENPYFARDLLEGLLHAADRSFRRYLKTGRYLRAKEEEAWAEPYIEEVIDADREMERAAAAEAEREAAMARITIDLTGLDRIRRDASITRDSLLTEAELGETSLMPEPGETSPESEPAEILQEAELEEILPGADSGGISPEPDMEEMLSEPDMLEMPSEPDPGERLSEPEAAGMSQESEPAEIRETGIEGMDLLHTQILRTLLRGGSVDGLLRENHLMPSLVADTINEVLYDEIGDNVVECDSDVITLVEDYREDLGEMVL